jgi:hypothetical protein
MEHVNHPVHYNKHPGGIECIEIIRHYTFDTGCAIKYLWRAGLKTEMGRSNRDKEREDLQKALWYAEDYHNHYENRDETLVSCKAIDFIIQKETGYTVEQIVEPYDEHVATALRCLLRMGIISGNRIYHFEFSQAEFTDIRFEIQARIKDLEKSQE